MSDQIEQLAKEMFEVCHYPHHEFWKDQDENTKVRWRYNAEIIADYLNRKHPPADGKALDEKELADLLADPAMSIDTYEDCRIAAKLICAKFSPRGLRLPERKVLAKVIADHCNKHSLLYDGCNELAQVILDYINAPTTKEKL